MMKFQKLLIVSALSVSLGTAAFSQTRTGEGVNRQIVSLKNMMESFANDIRPRINTLETNVNNMESDIQDLQDRENVRTACFNVSGDASVHWPTHPEADGNGCVSHEDLGGTDTVSSGDGCGQVRITWTGRYGNRDISCSATTSPTPHGVISSTSDAYGGECSHDTNYGTAHVLCNNGTYELQSNSFCHYNSNGEWRGDCR